MDLLIENPTITNIVMEVKKFETLQQAEILAYIRALRLKRDYKTPIAKYGNKIKPISMEEIDKIKHTIRKQHAGK